MQRKGLNKVKTRKALWDRIGWNYGDSATYLWKNHQLSCKCSYCRMKSFLKKYRHKQERIKARQELNKVMENND